MTVVNFEEAVKSPESDSDAVPAVSTPTEPTKSLLDPNALVLEPLGKPAADSRTPRSKRFVPPTAEEAVLHGEKLGLPRTEVENFLAFYESNGWMVGRNPMKCWTAAMVRWRYVWQSKGRPGIKPPPEANQIQEHIVLKSFL